jgi:hypothetical protein
MRLEIGAGAMAGVAVVVHADSGRVRVHLDAPRGTDIGEWRERISERLTRRGIEVDAIEAE